MLALNLEVNTAAARQLTRRNLPHPPAFRLSPITCSRVFASSWRMEVMMNGIIYLIGLVVVILFLLSLLGLR
jgi:hypothetical protein